MQSGPAGAGALMALLEERKRTLAAEGLFETSRKQALPFLPRTIGVGQGESEGDAAAEPGESAVARMKRRMRWRGDAEEAPWFEETGWSLLILACSLDDEPAVDELLALPEAELRRELDAKGKKGLVVSPMTWAKKGAPKHRAEPFAQLFCAYAEEMTALLATVAAVACSTTSDSVSVSGSSRSSSSVVTGTVTDVSPAGMVNVPLAAS